MLIAVFLKKCSTFESTPLCMFDFLVLFFFAAATKQQTVSLSIDSVFLKRQGVPVKLIKYRRSFMKLCW